jgi:hypothetical protein
MMYIYLYIHNMNQPTNHAAGGAYGICGVVLVLGEAGAPGAAARRDGVSTCFNTPKRGDATNGLS